MQQMDVQSCPLAWLILPVIILLALWDGTWKVIGMWKSARSNQLAWFVCIAIFNTVGILPILYILCFQKREAQESPANR